MMDAGLYQAAIITFILGCCQESVAQGRPWLPADSVAVRYLGAEDFGRGAERTAIGVSPAKRYVFVLTRFGSLERDCNINVLRVYSMAELQEFASSGRSREGALPRSNALTLCAASSSSWGISNLKWSADETAIHFVGHDANSITQVYQWKIGDLNAQQMTKEEVGITSFEVAGGSVAYNRVVETRDGHEIEYPITPAPRDRMGFVSHPRALNIRLTVESVFMREGKVVATSEIVPSMLRGALISPNGGKAVFVRWAALARDSREGRLRVENNHAVAENPDRRRRDAVELVFLDLKTGDISPILAQQYDSTDKEPVSDGVMTIVWSPDEQNLAVSNAPLPQTGRQMGVERGILVFHAGSLRRQVLEPMRAFRTADVTAKRQAATIEWIQDGKALLVNHSQAGEATPSMIYTLEKGEWAGHVASSASSIVRPGEDGADNGMLVAARQDMNQPFKVFASNRTGEVSVLEDDPALRGVWRATVVPFSWAMSDGSTLEGGLMLPKERSGRGAVPLVIQVYYYIEDTFLPDGPHSTGYAAQALVGKGMAVLQIPLARATNGVHEGLRFVEIVDSAVEALHKRGLVNRDRVGLVGFSRGGYQVHYAVTHPGRTPIAAAVSADAGGASFAWYLKNILVSTHPGSYKGPVGVKFWDDKRFWLEHETSFNADRVKAPTLFTENGTVFDPSKITHNQPGADAIATMGSFQLNGKPFDFLFFPTGSHALRRPIERYGSLRATVDWMSFWLQDEIDPDPAFSRQYQRWKAIRARSDHQK